MQRRRRLRLRLPGPEVLGLLARHRRSTAVYDDIRRSASSRRRAASSSARRTTRRRASARSSTPRPATGSADYIESGKREATLAVAVRAARGRLAGRAASTSRPHIFADVRPDAAIAQEEIFGPVAGGHAGRATSTRRWRIANGARYALTGGLYQPQPGRTSPGSRREFRVGNLYINRGITGALVERQPFGGFKMSGIGTKAGGPDYLLQFVEPRVDHREHPAPRLRPSGRPPGRLIEPFSLPRRLKARERTIRPRGRGQGGGTHDSQGQDRDRGAAGSRGHPRTARGGRSRGRLRQQREQQRGRRLKHGRRADLRAGGHGERPRAGDGIRHRHSEQEPVGRRRGRSGLRRRGPAGIGSVVPLPAPHRRPLAAGRPRRTAVHRRPHQEHDHGHGRLRDVERPGQSERRRRADRATAARRHRRLLCRRHGQRTLHRAAAIPTPRSSSASRSSSSRPPSSASPSSATSRA